MGAVRHRCGEEHQTNTRSEDGDDEQQVVPGEAKSQNANSTTTTESMEVEGLGGDQH